MVPSAILWAEFQSLASGWQGQGPRQGVGVEVLPQFGEASFQQKLCYELMVEAAPFFATIICKKILSSHVDPYN
jgi:hypothetical protein